MGLREIKARIATTMQAVPGMGKVYTFRRNLSAEKDQALLVGEDGRLHVWFVAREMTQLTDLAVNEGLAQQLDSLVLEGFLGVSDADDTEEIFDKLIDDVLQAVNADRKPPNSGGTMFDGLVETATTPSMRKMDFATYGQSQVLCHHAEIVIKVTPRYLQ